MLYSWQTPIDYKLRDPQVNTQSDDPNAIYSHQLPFTGLSSLFSLSTSLSLHLPPSE